jgi:hypothetical protein
MRFARIYHHYERLEEFQCGMWRMVYGADRDPFFKAAQALMKDPAAFKAAMVRAAHEWRYSCEHNLTARAVNRQAWIGHAGTCIATGAPEDITRQAWWTLNQAEQDAANAVADEAIAEWERLHFARVSGVNPDGGAKAP